MDIRQYSMWGNQHSLSIPKGARFLGAVSRDVCIDLYLEHPKDWTVMEYWHLCFAELGENVERNTGWTPDQYHLLQMLPAVPCRALGFLFRKIN